MINDPEEENRRTCMGLCWFVSYAWHYYVSREHDNWTRIPDVRSRLSCFETGSRYHLYWCQRALAAHPADLRKNEIGLSPEEVKRKAVMLELIIPWHRGERGGLAGFVAYVHHELVDKGQLLWKQLEAAERLPGDCSLLDDQAKMALLEAILRMKQDCPGLAGLGVERSKFTIMTRLALAKLLFLNHPRNKRG